MAVRQRHWYLDTSAALKLLVDEAESPALAEAIRDSAAVLVSTTLLETEMRRAAQRIAELSQGAVTGFLRGVDVYEIPPAIFTQAGLLPGSSLRSLDALHLAAAITLEVDAIATYDERLAEAADASGIPVIRPA